MFAKCVLVMGAIIAKYVLIMVVLQNIWNC